MKKEEQKSTKKDAIYITIIILLLAGIGYFGYQTGNVKKDLSACVKDNTQLNQEKEELNAILLNSGIIDSSDDAVLKANLVALLAEYDNVEASNQDMQDSIDVQKSKVAGLLAQVDSLNNLSAAEKKKAYGQIYKLKKEASTLREIMKSYIHTIDSLNTLNINLQNTIVDKDNQITNINNDLTAAKDESDKWKSTAELGSVLQSAGLIAEALKIKNSGTQKITTRANRTDQIRACFTIIGNKIAKAENKTLYMRIIQPNGKELVGEKPEVFSMGELDGYACIARKVNYQNTNMDVCIYYELENVIEAGNYIVEIYCEGSKIGKTTFALK